MLLHPRVANGLTQCRETGGQQGHALLLPVQSRRHFIRRRDPHQVSALDTPDSLQSPHDPDATYSGHKGKGYEVQVAESCHEENATQIITHVEVTPSSGSDATVTVPLIDALLERGIPPEELTAADFAIDATGARATICPAGHSSIDEYEDCDAPEKVEIHFARESCECCPLRWRCPVRLKRNIGVYVLKADLVKENIKRRRRAQASGAFAQRYAVRAGIEGTNSELKRAHGLGRLRVRGGPRVRLAVYLKALACNIKRMVRARLVEMAAQGLAETIPAVATS